MVKRVELTRDELDAVCYAIDNSFGPTEIIHHLVFGTWKKVLAHDGIEWTSETKIQPTDYAIPAIQWLQIDNRAVQRAKELSISDVGVVNISFDFMNYGPSAFDPKEDTDSPIL